MKGNRESESWKKYLDRLNATNHVQNIVTTEREQPMLNVHGHGATVVMLV